MFINILPVGHKKADLRYWSSYLKAYLGYLLLKMSNNLTGYIRPKSIANQNSHLLLTHLGELLEMLTFFFKKKY